MKNKIGYNLAVLSFPLQHPFAVLAQHFFPFEHFSFLPLSAIETPVIINAAVANKNIFFIYINCFVNNYVNLTALSVSIQKRIC